MRHLRDVLALGLRHILAKYNDNMHCLWTQPIPPLKTLTFVNNQTGHSPNFAIFL